MKARAQQSQVPIMFPSYASTEGRVVGHILTFVCYPKVTAYSHMQRAHIIGLALLYYNLPYQQGEVCAKLPTTSATEITAQ